MKFSEIGNRLTGISTPFGGVSWQPADLEVSAARRVVAFLEDRRVAPGNGNQKIAQQINAVNNCGSQANTAMNAGPPVAPTAQNIIDGIVAATYTVATDGAATVLSVVQKFLTGAAVRSAGHAAQDGLTFLTTYHGCLAAAGQGSSYNPYSPD